MSISQTIVAGLIGLVVAGAGAVGVYNFTTTGCFMGSCSSGPGQKTAQNAEQSNSVGLVVSENAAEAVTQGGSCCPLGEAGEAATTLVSDSVEGVADQACAADCATACAADATAEDADGCCGCGACGIAKTDGEPETDAPAPGDG